MQLHDPNGKRLYLTAEERRAFLAAAAKAARPVRTLCGVLHTTGCRISEALALTPERVDLTGKAVVVESLKKRRRGVYRAVPVPPGLLDELAPSIRFNVSRKRALFASPPADVREPLHLEAEREIEADRQ
jgi:integrase